MLSRCVVSQVKHNGYFLVGLALGLWLALAAVPLGEEGAACAARGAREAPGAAAAPDDEYAPHREEKPLGAAGAAGPASGRAVQRPRYYSTELGMRAPLLAAALTTEDALESRGRALNLTASRLQPALRFFLSARAAAAAPGAPGAPPPHRANVVAFTDAREMLKPFHALKYLADNYLDDYDFFFLASDAAYLNARRLAQLVSRLSAASHLYMGTRAGDDSHYCTLEGGILLSNSVLRAVHGQLDWCVRNSYSPRHHENIGRCVLHAAQARCQQHAQGESYVSVQLGEGGVGGAPALAPALADAVSAGPVAEPAHFHALHAYVSRVFLERSAAEARVLRAELRRAARRHPPRYRNHTWPAGLRADPGLAPPPPDSRFDHLRWTGFNATHAFLPDEQRGVAPLAAAHKQALHLVMEAVVAWAARRWAGAPGEPASGVALVEGAWLWEPARALRYRLLLRLAAGGGGGGHKHVLRQVEVCRALGAARLVPVPYVTESARVTLLVPLAGAADARDALQLLRRYEAAALRSDAAANTALIIVIVSVAAAGEEGAPWQELRLAVAALAGRHRGAQLELLEARAGGAGAGGAARAALAACARAGRPPRDALVLLAHARIEYNDDFLNRVRMNTLAGVSWYWPAGFARFAQFAHPRFLDAGGRRPAAGTGRFNKHHEHVLAFYRRDYDAAAAAWLGAGGAGGSVADVLARSPLRCVRAPEPGLVSPPPRAPCGGGSDTPAAPACLRAHRDAGFRHLDLGARAALARLLLELQADRQPPAAPAPARTPA